MLQVNALDHVNIVTSCMAETVDFYTRILDMEPHDPPPPVDPALVQWMHDASHRPIFHISSPGALLLDQDKDAEQGKGSGPVHHIALDCSGHSAMVARLSELGFDFRLNHVEAIDLLQIFVRDPNDVLIELNYRAGNQ